MGVCGHKTVDDGLGKPPAHIHNLKRDRKAVCRCPDPFYLALTVWQRKFHEETMHLVPLFLQEGGGNRGIHTTTHGNAYSVTVHVDYREKFEDRCSVKVQSRCL